MSLAAESEMVRSLDDISAIVRARRRHRHLTQEEVAMAAGVGRGVLQKLERGRGTITTDSLLRIATALALDVIVRPRQIGVAQPALER